MNITGWVEVGDRQIYVIHVIDSVLVALFAVVGIGLAPFRAVDTYHMIYIAHYHMKTWRLRRERKLPELSDPNDLPDASTEGGNNLNRNATVLAGTGIEIDLESGAVKEKYARALKRTNTALTTRSKKSTNVKNQKKFLSLPKWLLAIKNVFRKPVEEVEGITRQRSNLHNNDGSHVQPNEKKQNQSSTDDDDGSSTSSSSSSSANANDQFDDFVVLTPEQQAKLVYHQTKFARSHTFYKPHETFTHHAYPLWALITVVTLLDCHSFLQMGLSATTWGIYYKDRHKAITTVILCLSITCNITAGVIISIGDKRSRKKDIVEKLTRQELTSEAIMEMERKRIKRSKKEEQRSWARFGQMEREVGANGAGTGAESERKPGLLRKGKGKDRETADGNLVVDEGGRKG